MHLHKLADLLSFHEVAVGGTLPQTEYYREKLKRLHPMQMLSSNILLPLYEISLSYMTVRGNYRQAKKYAFLAEYSEVDFEAELLLKDWIATERGNSNLSLFLSETLNAFSVILLTITRRAFNIIKTTKATIPIKINFFITSLLS